jgi:hypothetical protein
LGREVTLCSDVALISSAKEPQCRLGTICILLDPIYKARSILYFRSRTKDSQYPAFVEWPSKLPSTILLSRGTVSLLSLSSDSILATLFKEPKEPSPKCKTLTLESSDGKSLSLSRNGLSRRSTQGSITTIGSFESTATAHARLQERSSGKGIKALVIEFHDMSGEPLISVPLSSFLET